MNLCAKESADGSIIICAGNDKNWRDLCGMLNRPDLPEDPRFSSNADRTTNHDALFGILSAILKENLTKNWMARLEAAGIPCGPVNTIADVVEDEQVAARDMVISIQYPDLGGIKAPGCPIKSRNYPASPGIPAPTLGQHNEELLGSLRST